MFRNFLPLMLVLVSIAMPAPAEQLTIGGDILVAGTEAGNVPPAGRDLFATGFSVRTSGPVTDDAHLSGFSVTVDNSVGGDLYAAGGHVAVTAPVGGDLSVMGGSLEIAAGTEVQGNARLMGGSVNMAGPVLGAAALSGGDVRLDAPIDGDVWIAAGQLSFGDAARIGGKLTYAAPEPVAIPVSVIPPERVSFRPLERGMHPEMMRDWAGDWPTPGPLTIIGGALATLAFFTILGAVFLAMMPERVERLRVGATSRPGYTLLSGVAGLSLLFGLVPVAAMTLVGLPAVPILLLAIVTVWVLGYLLGAYAVVLRMLEGLSPPDRVLSAPMRILALFLGIALASLLNFIPVLGWLANFAIVLLGIGALHMALFEAFLPRRNGDGTIPVQ